MSKNKKSFMQTKRMGSTKEGAHHWLLMRLSALALLFLIPWFAYSLMTLSTSGFSLIAQMSWLQHPLNMGGMILFLLISAHHSGNGMQIVIEDYVPHMGLRLSLIYGFKGLTYVAALFTLLALFTLFNGAL